MIAAIDARNRALRVGLGDLEAGGVRWRARFRVGADPRRSAEEYAWALAGLCGRHGVDPGEADRVLLSSVVPALTPRLRSACAQAFGGGLDPGKVLVVGPGIRTGMKIRTDIPGEVGSDLVCDALAAYDRLGAACIVVDFETALTFTAVNGSGELLGVAIAPGPQAAAESLRALGAQLPQVRLDPPARAIGKNSIQSIQSGVLLGYAGLVDRMVSRFRAEMGEEAAAVGTGDEIGLSLAPSGGYAFFDPWLSLEGMAVLERRNR
ncbi:MAG TPA: type III pantothenate kinase [Magnetospirillaceae bacterium]|nr:type III pantothenate kinase [Magnetospirillaceae bacterium]